MENNKIPNEMKRPGRRKKYILLVSLALLGVGFSLLTSAIWAFTLSNSALYEITSTDPGDSGNFNIIQNWTGISMNTDDAPGSFKDKLIIENLMDPIDVIFNVDEVKTDADDLCLSYETDCQIWYEISSIAEGYKGIIADGDTFTLDTGDNFVWVVLNCERFSCPGNISIEAVIIPA